MNELQEVKFDYKQLDEDTASFLQQKENNMREIVGKAYTNLGKELKEAQDELAGKNQYDGMFEKWLSSIGFNKVQANRLINRYELVTKCNDQKEMLEDLPVSLTYEISKPSANKELTEMVLNEEIKTLKQYKELETKLEDEQKKRKMAEEMLKRIEEEAKENKHKDEEEKRKLNQLLQEAETRNPKVIEKEIIKEVLIEVVPQNIKEEIKEKDRWLSVFKNEIKDLEEEVKGLKLQQENDEPVDDEQLEKKQKRLEREANIETLQIVVNINNFLKETSLSAYQVGAIATSNNSTKKRIKDSVDMLREFSNNLENAVNSRIHI